jgi:hypothetical protein
MYSASTTKLPRLVQSLNNLLQESKSQDVLSESSGKGNAAQTSSAELSHIDVEAIMHSTRYKSIQEKLVDLERSISVLQRAQSEVLRCQTTTIS